MSHIGKKSIYLAVGVDVNINNSLVYVKGKLGELSQKFNSNLLIEKVDNILTVNAKDPESEIAKIISELNKIKIGIIGVKILNNSLEDVFIELTGHGINEGESIDK